MLGLALVPDPPAPPGELTPSTRTPLSNDVLAAAFDRVADLLEVGHANPHRIRAYRAGATTLRNLDAPAAQLLDEGGPGALVALPHIGTRLAAAVAEMLERGTFGLLTRLEGDASPEELLGSVVGVGPVLAARIHDTLGVETLEELEMAAHDGRIESVPGFGPRRAEALRHTLDAILRRSGAVRRAGFEHRRSRALDRSPPATSHRVRPDVSVLLDVDAEYQQRAQAGKLRKIAPRRFNPDHEAWLPIMHTHRSDWDFDVMFSNTALAHELRRTDDWVVIYWHRGPAEGQCTVVTERTGPDRGYRVVRGRELQCRAARG